MAQREQFQGEWQDGGQDGQPGRGGDDGGGQVTGGLGDARPLPWRRRWAR
jgi:hypothetical protein